MKGGGEARRHRVKEGADESVEEGSGREEGRGGLGMMKWGGDKGEGQGEGTTQGRCVDKEGRLEERQ